MTSEDNILLAFQADFPRASRYDPDWVIDNMMGPNALWLAESLSQVMDLRPGMRVLDMGCGKALSSIFLAREFGVEIWATDLWIRAEDNITRIIEAGLEDRIHAVHADAHKLPFDDGFFDASVSFDAYHYFGTEEAYLGEHYAKLIKDSGQIGVVVPGLLNEFADGPPPHLQRYWEPDFSSFHSPAWWRGLWEQSGCVQIERADSIPDGWRHWLAFQEAALDRHPDEQGGEERDMVRQDAGRTLGFSRMVAKRMD